MNTEDHQNAITQLYLSIEEPFRERLEALAAQRQDIDTQTREIRKEIRKLVSKAITRAAARADERQAKIPETEEQENE